MRRLFSPVVFGRAAFAALLLLASLWQAQADEPLPALGTAFFACLILASLVREAGHAEE